MNQKKSLRNCPICQEENGEILHTQNFVLPEGHPLSNGYDILCCDRCGFVYADTTVSQKDRQFKNETHQPQPTSCRSVFNGANRIRTYLSHGRSPHRFYIKGESVASKGVWIAKKRYAMNAVYDLVNRNI